MHRIMRRIIVSWTNARCERAGLGALPPTQDVGQHDKALNLIENF
jgi:hypothetical protein